MRHEVKEEDKIIIIKRRDHTTSFLQNQPDTEASTTTKRGITEEAVREEKHIEYVRGLDAAYAKVLEGAADAAFLLEPTTIEQVANVAFSGGVMPQKSTDFYPKLLSGLTIYKLEQ